MRSPLFISSTFLPDQSLLRTALDICDGLEIDGVELGSNHCYEPNYEYLSNYDFRYLTHNYFPIPEEGFVVNIASNDDVIQDQSLKHIFRAIDFTADMGGELYTFHPGFRSDPDGAARTDKNYDFAFSQDLEHASSDAATERMYASLDTIVAHARKRNVSIAIETEGSVRHHRQLLMQQIEEFGRFMSRYSSQEVGINLNIGHLNLASKTFNFEPGDFVELVKSHVIAMELSHNLGTEDSHLPLEADQWYWPQIFQPDLANVPKILEFRDASRKQLESNIELFRRTENEFC